jgi:hypothetical protein
MDDDQARFVVVLPASETLPIEVRRLAPGRDVYDEASTQFGSDSRVEHVRPGGLSALRDVSAVMLVDESGHPKGLALNRRAGALYGGPIAGDAVFGEWSGSELGAIPLTREMAEGLRALLETYGQNVVKTG